MMITLDLDLPVRYFYGMMITLDLDLPVYLYH